MTVPRHQLISDTVTGAHPGDRTDRRPRQPHRLREVHGQRRRVLRTGDANFEAGDGNPSTGANCTGIIIVSWSSTNVVLRFGNASGTFAHWFPSNGHGVAISVDHGPSGGTGRGLS